MNSENLHSAISSQESAVGRLPCNLPGGLQLDLFGPAPALASPSVPPVKEKALTITGTSGLNSAASLRTASLQQSLENRLRQQMDVNGSPEYALTWKRWDMESGPPICALRASQRRISDKDYTGWPTPRTVTGGAESAERKQELGRTQSGGGDLQAVAMVAGWPSPAVQNASGGPSPLGNVGEHFTLQTAAVLAGWPTVRACEGSNPPMGKDGRHAGLTQVVVGWPTPTNSMMTEQDIAQAMTAGNGGDRKPYGESLIFPVASWVTPSSRDYKDTPGISLTGTNPDGSVRTRLDQLPRQAAIAGQTTLSFHVETAKRGVLNPDLPRWLMGYPEGWGSFADTVTRFVRK